VPVTIAADVEHVPRHRPGGPLWAAMVGASSVVGQGLRLFGRHWPTLLALVLVGLAGRTFVIDQAVKVSDVNALLGYLVFSSASIPLLLALVVMLRAMRPSLRVLGKHGLGSPAATGDATPPRGRLLGQVGSVLVPFIIVYASYGYFRDDLSGYLYKIFEAEVVDRPGGLFDPGPADVKSRLPFAITATLFAVIAVAAALRWVISRRRTAVSAFWLGVVAAYLEIVWITTVLGVADAMRVKAAAWLEGRRLVHGVSSTFSGVVHWFGPLRPPTESAFGWLFAAVGAITPVIVVPVAWLAVGAVVYGRSVSTPPRHARTTEDDPATASVGLWLRDHAVSLVRGRFGQLIDGLRLLFRAGLGPMLLFCLAFVFAQTVATWLWELERVFIGPHDLMPFWRPVSLPLSIVNDAIGLSLLICLVAAAVDRVSGLSAGPVPSEDRQPEVVRQVVAEHDADGDRAGGGGEHEVGQPLVR
jgi:hypothetical protein